MGYVNSEQKVKYATEEQVISVLEFYFNNIIVEFGVNYFNKLTAFPFFQKLTKTRRPKKSDHLISHLDILRMFFSFDYPNFSDWVPLIYSRESETKDTSSSAPFFRLLHRT